MLLALCVLLTHSAFTGLPHLPGSIAVEAFFVVSVFYMALVLTEKYTPARLGRSWVMHFYLSRYLRLYPSYILSVLAILSLTIISQALFNGTSTLFAAWTKMLSLPLTVRNLLL